MNEYKLHEFRIDALIRAFSWLNLRRGVAIRNEIH